MNLPFSVPLDLKLWKVDIISDLSKYLLLIVEFYQRIFPLYLCGLQCCCYLKDLPIGNMASGYSFDGGRHYTDDRHYICKKILMDHND